MQGSRYRNGGGPAALAAVLALAMPSAQAQKAKSASKPEPPCLMTAFDTVQIAEIVDGRTLRLTDGREVRLAGIDLPPDPAATAQLAAATGQTDLILKHLKPLADRYGRIIAEAVASRDGVEIPLGHELVARGLARVAADAATVTCVTPLRTAERAAQAGQLGLWADPRYLLRQADDPAGVLTERGHAAIVEGVVVSVRESGGTIYVNFGRRWSEDFTVTILKRNARRFTAAGIEPKALQGRRVRVRGVVEERGGPWIEATTPGQIEIVSD